jgi:hypothetical protein
MVMEFELTATSRVHLDFLDRKLLVQEGTLAEEVQGLLAIVGESNLDLRVARRSKLDAQGSLALVYIDRSSGGNRCQSGDGDLARNLHSGRLIETRVQRARVSVVQA